jgi:DNA helicase-2/ATP-dependent DNA helicase PcrA
LGNSSQIAAITHEFGPVLCLAGPGSGKTFTLTHRIRHLILEKQIDPARILVITFSKAAAKQMEQRFYKLMNDQYYPVRFGTFHAIFFQILSRYEGYTIKDILTLSQKKKYLKTILLQMDYQGKLDIESMEMILSQISYFKNRYKQVHASEIEKKIPQFQSIFRQYENLIRQEHKLDFDDMLVLCYELLQKRQDILDEYAGQFEHILIDEYQDINPIQYEIIKGLIKPHGNLFAVGDDDQSIYGFRGSDPSIMLCFQNDFTDGTIISLDKNYRSTKGIVDFAKQIIRENKARYDKEMIAMKEGNGVQLRPYESKEEQYRDLIEKFHRAKTEENLQNHACLFRTNMDASYLAELLLKEKIPYVMKEKPYNPYDHFICMDLIHYLHLKEGNFSIHEFVPVMNRPLRYISREAIDTFKGEVDFDLLKRFYAPKEYMIKNIQKLEYDLIRMKNMDLFAAIHYIRKGIGYDEYLKKQAMEQNVPIDEYMKTADELQKRFGMFQNLEELEIHIDNYRENIVKTKQNQHVEKEGVHIMTYHASKGLEFDTVHLPDCNEGNIPYKKSTTQEQIEEERRLFYVAITRAKEEVHITYVEGNKTTRHLRSRFLNNVDKTDFAGR